MVNRETSTALHTLRLTGLPAYGVDDGLGEEGGPNKVPVGVLSGRVDEDIPPRHGIDKVDIGNTGGVEGGVVCLITGKIVWQGISIVVYELSNLRVVTKSADDRFSKGDCIFSCIHEGHVIEAECERSEWKIVWQGCKCYARCGDKMVVDQVICGRYIEAVSKKDRGVSFGDANGHCSSSKGGYNIGNLLREMKQGFAGGPVVENNNDFLAPQIVPQGPVAGRDIPFEALSIDSMNTCC
jgi:hypothetical protein